MKIGIIGSGIAGLSAAWFLKNAGHQVTLLEKCDRIGMSAHCMQLEVDDKIVHADVPSRMFNAAQWPNLMELYRELGVEVEPVDTTQSFSNASGETYLKLELPYRFADPRVLFQKETRRILADMKRLRTEGERDLENGAGQNQSLSSYLNSNSYSREFVFQFLYPILSSTVCTCSYSSLNQYPADTILSTIRNISVDQTLYKTKYGTRDVVDRLSAELDVQTDSYIQNLDGQQDGMTVRNGNGTVGAFEHVVVATQANHAQSLIGGRFDSIKQPLASISYETVPVVVHRDERLMPSEKRNWATFNILTQNESTAMCSVWMNRFHKDWKIETPVFQTINPFVAPQDDLVEGRFFLQRPVVTLETSRQLKAIDDFHGGENRRLWFCGSFAAEGVPLLETGVVSAKSIASQISEIAISLK